jgi:hypothetical protein
VPAEALRRLQPNQPSDSVIKTPRISYVHCFSITRQHLEHFWTKGTFLDKAEKRDCVLLFAFGSIAAKAMLPIAARRRISSAVLFQAATYRRISGPYVDFLRGAASRPRGRSHAVHISVSGRELMCRILSSALSLLRNL